jgi:uncharacterized protein YciI
MTDVQRPAVYYVVNCELAYDSFEAARATAADAIAAHVARSKELHAQGTLLMSGAFLDAPHEPLRTMAICATREGAEDYIRGDPFVLNGKVSHWSIRAWANMFA